MSRRPTERPEVNRLRGAFAPTTPTRETTAVSGDGARLPVEIHGADSDPAVVLVHGWTCSTLFWAPVIRELTASGHRVITYDQRGHGRGPVGEPAAYSPALLADDLCAVLDAALEPGERAVIGGHSMGAMTLLATAGRRQLRERGAALMLCSTGLHDLRHEARVVPLSSRRLRGVVHGLALRTTLPLGPLTPVTRKALAYATLGAGPDRDTAEATARIVHACPRRARGAWGGVLARLDLAERARELTVPTAVVCGTHDRLTPIVHAREIAAALPHCVELRELPKRGHMTPLEEPGTVSAVLAGLVRDHLGDHPRDAGSTDGAAGDDEAAGDDGAGSERAGGAEAEAGAGEGARNGDRAQSDSDGGRGGRAASSTDGGDGAAAAANSDGTKESQV